MKNKDEYLQLERQHKNEIRNAVLTIVFIFAIGFALGLFMATKYLMR